MGSHRRPATFGYRLVFMLACLAAVAVIFTAATEAGSVPRQRLRPAGPPPAKGARDAARYAAMKRRLASPAERAGRRRSRIQFQRLSQRPALALAARTFPRVFGGKLWRGPRLRRGERVAR